MTTGKDDGETIDIGVFGKWPKEQTEGDPESDAAFDEWFDSTVRESEGYRDALMRDRHDVLLKDLDDKLADDIGYAGSDGLLSALAEMKTHDKAKYLRAEQMLRHHKVLSQTRKEVTVRARTMRGLHAVPDDEESSQYKRVLDAIDDAPVDAGAIVPPGWELRKYVNPGQHVILRVLVKKRGDEYVEERIGVCADPMVVTGKLYDLAAEDTRFEVSARIDDTWRRVLLNRGRMSRAAYVAEDLGSADFPVHANNASDVIQYLVDYERANRKKIERRFCTEQMGWQGEDGEDGFLIGDEHIEPGPRGRIEYNPAGAGERHLVRCLKRHGDLDVWRDGMRMLDEYPRARLAVIASLAPVLLPITRVPNFIVDYCGKTSNGKTTTLSVGASVWGDPDPNSESSYLVSWDMTPVGFERRAAALNHMPLVVDDTKRAQIPRGGESVIPKVLYAISNGIGRVRGDIKGTQQTRYFRTVMLTSGEQRSIDFSKDAGTAARVLTLWGSPFGNTNARTAKDIDSLKRVIYQHHGLAGPAFVELVTSLRGEWDEWFDQIVVDREAFRDKLIEGRQVKDLAITDRIGGALAVLKLAERLAIDELGIPWTGISAVDAVLGSIAGGSKGTDRERDALVHVYDVAAANRKKFKVGRPSRDIDDEPYGGWLGYWEEAGEWDCIALYSPKLKEILERAGYESNSILRVWRELGIIECDRGFTYRIRTGSSHDSPRERMVKITRSALTRWDIVDPRVQPAFDDNNNPASPF